jgi:hypothetical protein
MLVMKSFLIISLLVFNINSMFSQSFLENQKNYERVKTAYKEKLSNVEMLLMASNIGLKDLQLLFRIFKQEKH